MGLGGERSEESSIIQRCWGVDHFAVVGGDTEVRMRRREAVKWDGGTR